MTNSHGTTSLAVFTLLLASLPCFAEPPANLLLGVWQHATFVQTADGRTVRKYESHDGSTLTYSPNGTWRLNNPPHWSSGTYRWLSDDLLQSTITDSDLTKQIGFTSVKKVAVSERELVLVIEHNKEAMKVFPASPHGPRPSSMTITSTFRRAKGN